MIWWNRARDFEARACFSWLPNNFMDGYAQANYANVGVMYVMCEQSLWGKRRMNVCVLHLKLERPICKLYIIQMIMKISLTQKCSKLKHLIDLNPKYITDNVQYAYSIIFCVCVFWTLCGFTVAFIIMNEIWRILIGNSVRVRLHKMWLQFCMIEIFPKKFTLGVNRIDKHEWLQTFDEHSGVFIIYGGITM